MSDFNNLIIQSFPNDIQTFTSVDSTDINEQLEMGEHELLAEFLQGLNSACLPPSKLKVKIGAPVILLQNLDLKAGLCNGTWMTITRLNNPTMEVHILRGQFDRNTHILPHIKLSTTDELHFQLTRKQFPIHLSFAMIVNKAQGQSLDHVGLNLHASAFTHG